MPFSMSTRTAEDDNRTQAHKLKMKTRTNNDKLTKGGDDDKKEDDDNDDELLKKCPKSPPQCLEEK